MNFDTHTHTHTHTATLFAAYNDAMRHFVLTEGSQQGQDTEARVRHLVEDFFDQDVEDIEAQIEGHRQAVA